MSAPSRAPERAYPKAEIPAGRSGEWVVEKFTQEDRGSVSQSSVPEWMRYRPGSYTRLKKGPVTYMTDLYEEWWTQKEAIDRACVSGGEILITGLGLGLVVKSILEDPHSLVRRVTVVEASRDVVSLTAPHLGEKYGSKLKIVHADAFTWMPPSKSRYTVGWHDIWPNPYDTDILPEMDEIERRYAPYCDWQACWARDFTSKRNEARVP